MILFRGKCIDTGKLVYGYYNQAVIGHFRDRIQVVDKDSKGAVVRITQHDIDPKTIEFKVGDYWFPLSEFESMAMQSNQYKLKTEL